MCLTTEKKIFKFEPVIETLEKDLIVYKVVYLDKKSNEIFSPFRYFKYTMGELNSVEKFTYKRLREKKNLVGIIRYTIQQGFHSFVNVENAFQIYNQAGAYGLNRNHLEVAEFRIPAGSQVIRGFWEDMAKNAKNIVSTQIILEEIISDQNSI